MKEATTAIILETRKTLSNGKHPVKLRVTFQRRQKYYTIGKKISKNSKLDESLSKEEFNKVFSTRPRGDYKELRVHLNHIEEKAEKIIKDLPLFTFPAFEKLFRSKSGNSDSIFNAYEEVINRLKLEGREGTKSNYECSRNSLKLFAKERDKRFNEITPEWLLRYERWMITNGRSLTTVGIYIRPLRALFNEAIEEGHVSAKLYPFGRRKYVIPQGQNIKKAIPLSDIEKIYNYKPKEYHKWKAQRYWLFSYLCNGINIADIARLKYKNIDGGTTEFVRTKTSRTTKKKRKPITAYLTPKAKEIVEELGQKPKAPETYVFDILIPGMTPEEELRTVRNLTRFINQHMEKIGEELGIERKVTTLTARHSFSTILRNSGANVAMISEMLGHKTTATTENYLDSFEDSQKKAFIKQLTNFKSKKKEEPIKTLKAVK